MLGKVVAIDDFWTRVGAGDVVHVVGADFAMFRGLPRDAPAVVEWKPSGWVDARAVLGELERQALSLYPRWLPGAEAMGRTGGAMVVGAVRSLALRHAADTHQYGPFLADLAERALSGGSSPSSFPDAVRAIGLARVIATANDRAMIALAVDISPGISTSEEDVMISACERIASHGQFAVWLVGPAPRSPRIRSIVLERPPAAAPGPVRYWAPRAGRPHPGSAVEQALEEYLCRRAWAVGREWNQHYQVDMLSKSITPDLMWADERVVVELDGLEHLEPDRFVDDRRRDVDLQLAGYVVLRFPNSEVEHDIGRVAARIERMLTIRRGRNGATRGR